MPVSLWKKTIRDSWDDFNQQKKWARQGRIKQSDVKPLKDLVQQRVDFWSGKTKGGSELSLHGGVQQASFGSAVKAVGGKTKQTLEQLGEAAVAMPSGVYYAGKSVGLDVRDVATKGDVGFHRTRQVAKETGQSFYRDVTDPWNRPGYLLADILATGAGMGGTITKLGAFGRGVAEAEGSAAARLAAGARSAHESGIHFGELRSGETKIPIPLSQNAPVRAFQKSRLARQQAKLDTGVAEFFGIPVNKIVGERGAARLEQVTKKPILKEFTAEARFGRALRSTARINQDINFSPGMDVAHRLTWATRRVKEGNKWVYKTDPARETSLALVGVFGNEALRNPSGVIKVFVERHRQIISDLENRLASNNRLRGAGKRQLQRQIEAQHQLIASADGALQYLQDKPPEFLDAIGAVRDLSKQTEGMKLANEYMTPEEASGRLAAIHGFYTGDAITPEGAFYFPTHSRYALGGAKPVPPRGSNFGGGQYGIGPPSVTGKGKHWEGTSLEHGIPAVTHATMEEFNRHARYTSTLNRFRDLYNAGHDVKVEPDWIPVRETKSITRDLRDVMKNANVYFEKHPDAESLPRPLVDRIKEAVGGSVTAHVGERVEGVRWVDPRFLKDMGSGGKLEGTVGSFVEMVNNTARFGQLYLRPGYAWNAPQNAAMAAVVSGFASPWHIYQGVKSVKLYGHKIDSMARSVVGESRTQAYDIGGATGKIAAGSHKLARGWNTVTDLWFRRAMFYYNASKMGYYGKTGLTKLAERDKNGKYVRQADIQKIGQMTRKDAVDFDSLTPEERDRIRHIIYFYPWVSRGTSWAVRAQFEHPIKAAVGYHLGEVGQQHNPIWQILPQWAKDSGIFAIRDLGEGNVLTINPAALSTPTTVVQTARAIADLAGMMAGKKSTGEFLRTLTPMLESLVGGDTMGGIPGLVEGLPVWLLLARLGVPLPGKKTSKTYPATGPWAALGPYAGAVMPRVTSKSALAAQKAKETGSSSGSRPQAGSWISQAPISGRPQAR